MWNIRKNTFLMTIKQCKKGKRDVLPFVVNLCTLVNCGLCRGDTVTSDECCIFPVWFVLLLGRSVFVDKGLGIFLLAILNSKPEGLIFCSTR